MQVARLPTSLQSRGPDPPHCPPSAPVTPVNTDHYPKPALLGSAGLSRLTLQTRIHGDRSKAVSLPGHLTSPCAGPPGNIYCSPVASVSPRSWHCQCWDRAGLPSHGHLSLCVLPESRGWAMLPSLCHVACVGAGQAGSMRRRLVHRHTQRKDLGRSGLVSLRVTSERPRGCFCPCTPCCGRALGLIGTGGHMPEWGRHGL